MKIVLVVLVSALLACSRPPKQEEAPAEPSKLLVMTAEAQRHVGLETTRIAFEDLKEYLHVVGAVQPIDSQIGHVSALARGRVEAVHVRVGDRVRRGESLATFENIEAGELRAGHQGALAELERLKLQAAAAQRVAERNRELSELGAIAKKTSDLSQLEAESAAASVRVQENVVAGLASRARRFGVEPVGVIRAPFAGVVIQAQAAPGDLFDSSRELFSIADLSRVWVQAEVYEQDLSRVEVGQSAIVTVDTYSNEKFTGRVTYLSDLLDPRTRTARVRCEVANPDIRLKVDMFASIELPTHFSRRALVVPVSAIQQMNGSDVAFVRKSPAAFERRTVKLGKTLADTAEIVSGLSEGEEVVKTGSFHLKSISLSGQIGEQE